MSELDRYIIGQEAAKRSVAVALRNRWRRQQLPADLKEEVLPKNILMVGPTGCGKTEIARRLAKLVRAPFIKVEATKFTEVGYVGRDVDQIIRDLVGVAVQLESQEQKQRVQVQAEKNAEKRVLDALVSTSSGETARSECRHQLRQGLLDEKIIEIEVLDSAPVSMPTLDIPGMPGASMGMLNLGEFMGKGFGKQYKKRRITVADAHKVLMEEEAEKLLDNDKVHQAALERAEQDGIVFIDEIDKITVSGGTTGQVSREGVQRDLLPLLEGTTVATKYGSVKTDHVLFITSGAFHQARPSDLLAELQGRLPIRVSLSPLWGKDFLRILQEPENNLIKQYMALMATEGVSLSFSGAALERIAVLAEEINSTVENIGARRLHTLLEKILEDISFSATDMTESSLAVSVEYVNDHMKSFTEDTNLEKFIL